MGWGLPSHLCLSQWRVGCHDHSHECANTLLLWSWGRGRKVKYIEAIMRKGFVCSLQRGRRRRRRRRRRSRSEIGGWVGGGCNVMLCAFPSLTTNRTKRRRTKSSNNKQAAPHPFVWQAVAKCLKQQRVPLHRLSVVLQGELAVVVNVLMKASQPPHTNATSSRVSGKSREVGRRDATTQTRKRTIFFNTRSTNSLMPSSRSSSF